MTEEQEVQFKKLCSDVAEIRNGIRWLVQHTASNLASVRVNDAVDNIMKAPTPAPTGTDLAVG